MGWLAVLIGTYLARNINTSFNEYREMLAICIISSIVITYLTVVHHILDNYIIVRWARDTTTIFEYFAGQSPLFILLGVPVYNCIFHRAEYQRRFFQKMRADGMATIYGCSSRPSITRPATASGSLTAYPTLPPMPTPIQSPAADNKV
ncbi:hypothetical protein GGI00_001700 [Coemansia sp. RSA 2681]|nr:hypothetical protein GGI00_001700 [Coemansia sp. RSA 2681]